MVEESLGRRAGRAAIWQVAGGGWQTLVRLCASFYLARALKPSDFGLFGMALLYQSMLVTAFSLGFGVGLIVKKDLMEEDLNTSFWLSFIVRILVFLVVFFTAPLAAKFWKEPRVEPVIRIISFVLLISLISIIPETLAKKNLEFKKINIIRGIAILLESFTAVVLVALTNLTYWALVISMMINAIFYNFTLWLSTGAWYPKFIFCQDAFRYLFRFGLYNWFISFVNYLKENIDYFLVGRFLGSYNLGLYEFAYRLPHLVFERISIPVGGVLFSTFSKLQDDDFSLFRSYVMAIKYIGLFCFPLLLWLIIAADILVPVFWGNQWLPIIHPLQILCVCALWRCVVQPLGSILLCKYKPEITAKFSFLELILAIFLVSFLSKFGLIGVSIAMLLSLFPSLFLLMFTLRYINASLLSFLSYLRLLLFFCFLFFFIVLFVKVFICVKFSNNIFSLFLLSFFSLICYIVLLFLFFQDELKTLKNLIF